MRLIVLVLIASSTIGCDRVTKQLATALLADRPTRSLLADTVRLQYAENAGGFLSLGAGLPPGARSAIFTAATALLLAVLFVASLRSRSSFWRTAGVSLLFAGGVSNLIDRVLRGTVVDFLNVGVGWLRTGIFNVADVAIMLGIGIVVLTGLSVRVTRRKCPDRQG
jgi:signal peptidase II